MGFYDGQVFAYCWCSLHENARQVQIYLLILLRNWSQAGFLIWRTKPGRFPYLEDEARQVSLYVIVPCTRMKNGLELISYPSIFLLRLKFDNDVMIQLGHAVRLWNGPRNRGMGLDFKTKIKRLANKRTEQACRWGFKPFMCEMRLREYKSTLIEKGLNYFISVKLLILETTASQRPWLCLHRAS